MKTESLVISKHSSGHVKFTSLIISIRHVGQTECEVVIGNPGLPNVTRKMENGDAVLYETTQDGIIEVRMVGLNFMSDTAKFLVSQVSPMARLLAGTLNTDPNNSPFNEAELAQIAESIANAKVELRKIFESGARAIGVAWPEARRNSSRSSADGPKRLDQLCGRLADICVYIGCLRTRNHKEYFSGGQCSFRLVVHKWHSVIAVIICPTRQSRGTAQKRAAPHFYVMPHSLP